MLLKYALISVQIASTQLFSTARHTHKRTEPFLKTSRIVLYLNSWGQKLWLLWVAAAFLLTSRMPLLCSDYSLPGTVSPWQPHSRTAFITSLFWKWARWEGNEIYMFWVPKWRKGAGRTTDTRGWGEKQRNVFSFSQFASLDGYKSKKE